MNGVAFTGGHGGFGSSALDLIARTQAQIEEVAQFDPAPRDYRAPRMNLAPSLPAAPLAEMQASFDLTI